MCYSSDGDFLSIQVYAGETHDFPKSFSIAYTENHWSNTEKYIEFFEEIIFPYLAGPATPGGPGGPWPPHFLQGKLLKTNFFKQNI